MKPYQPDGVWEEIFMGRFKYEPSEGMAQHRRTLYAFWRTLPGFRDAHDVRPLVLWVMSVVPLPLSVPVGLPPLVALES